MNATEKNELLAELKLAVEAYKEKAQFSATFDELEKALFIGYSTLENGFVDPHTEGMLRNAWGQLFDGWSGFLQRLLFPQQMDVQGIVESSGLTEEQKTTLRGTYKRLRKQIALSYSLKFNEDLIEQGKFIDSSAVLWTETKQTITSIVPTLVSQWEKPDEEIF